ncbi:hypothetical protein GGR51DRAFT_578026 [Nemania sp. FL0031]|nr:hypothetical protein GGR51DRAFT_578026 [Nemania sp. FL0031]
MLHRQSCDRCRQQKVRCRRDESQRWNNSSSPEKGPPSRCERCAKAAVDCVYSLKRRSKRRASHHRQSSITLQAGQNPDPRSRSLSNGWIGQEVQGPSYSGGPLLSPNITVGDRLSQFPSVFGEGEAIDGFHSWDADLQGLPSSSLNPLIPPSTSNAALALPTSITSSSHGEDEDSECEDEDEEDASDTPYSQLTALSDRATRAMRSLARPGRAPLTASSPEVNGALEDTNTLIRIIGGIIAPQVHEDSYRDPTTTNCGLVFSAFACHQHLIALFRAICEVIHRSLQATEEQQKKQPGSRTDMEPSSVAHCVMVLQLLTHLVNRIDRSLFQGSPAIARGPFGGYITPTTPEGGNSHTMAFGSGIERGERGDSSSAGGLLGLVHEIIGTIPSEHEKLRETIRRLQTEMEGHELH